MRSDTREDIRRGIVPERLRWRRRATGPLVAVTVTSAMIVGYMLYTNAPSATLYMNHLIRFVVSNAVVFFDVKAGRWI